MGGNGFTSNNIEVTIFKNSSNHKLIILKFNSERAGFEVARGKSQRLTSYKQFEYESILSVNYRIYTTKSVLGTNNLNSRLNTGKPFQINKPLSEL